MSGTAIALLAAAALAAGLVNGFLGYGFSSLMVPSGLIFAPVRLLNPALTLIELPLNCGAALIHRRRALPLLEELRPFTLALLPGIVLGALLLRHLPAGPLKLICYGLLLPLVLVQRFARPAAPRPLSQPARATFGVATGLCYGLTTLSGPPLSLYAQARGYGKDDARAAISLLRALESLLAAGVFGLLGLFTAEGLHLALALLGPSLAGLLIGHALATRVAEDRFRRLAIHFNLLAIAVGLVRALGVA